MRGLKQRADYMVQPVFASVAKQSSLGAAGLPRCARKDGSDNRYFALAGENCRDQPSAGVSDKEATRQVASAQVRLHRAAIGD